MNRIEAIRSEFSETSGADYYNSAGSTLIPRSAKEAVGRFMEDSWSDSLAAFGKYRPVHERLRNALASMMGASPGEVAVTHHTAEGTSVIANGLEWSEGDVILTLDREYPSTIYPWMQLERTHGVRLELLKEEGGRVPEGEIVEAIHRLRPRLFAISAVEWCSGYRFDLEPIGRACAEAGTFFFVDSAQALGFSEVDVRACHIDAMAGSAWKWLFGPFGQGYLYLRSDRLEEITPRFVGSDSVVEAEEYLDYNLLFKPDASRFEYSTANLSALVWFDAGIRFVQDCGGGELRSHVFALQDHAADGLQSLGAEVRGIGPVERRSGIMAFRLPGIDSRTLSTLLHREHGIFARERDGFVRLAFHFYNTRSGIDRLLQCLEAIRKS